MVKDALFQGKKEVRTFTDLNHGSDVLLGKMEADAEGSFYTAMSSILLRAFMFEAYLNHLGNMLIPHWSDIESISVWKKYSVLCSHLGMEPDFSKRPYQTIRGVFRLRNSIAHGKSEIVAVTKEVSSEDDPIQHMPTAYWEEYCNSDNAKRAKEDIEKVITELHDAAGLGKYPFVPAAGSGSMSYKGPNK